MGGAFYSTTVIQSLEEVGACHEVKTEIKIDLIPPPAFIQQNICVLVQSPSIELKVRNATQTRLNSLRVLFGLLLVSSCNRHLQFISVCLSVIRWSISVIYLHLLEYNCRVFPPRHHHWQTETSKNITYPPPLPSSVVFFLLRMQNDRICSYVVRMSELVLSTAMSLYYGMCLGSNSNCIAIYIDSWIWSY